MEIVFCKINFYSFLLKKIEKLKSCHALTISTLRKLKTKSALDLRKGGLVIAMVLLGLPGPKHCNNFVLLYETKPKVQIPSKN